MLPSVIGRIGSLGGFAALQVSTAHSMAANPPGRVQSTQLNSTQLNSTAKTQPVGGQASLHRGRFVPPRVVEVPAAGAAMLRQRAVVKSV
jgi:hypothetical protein